MLLYAQGKFDDFHQACKSLLFNMYKDLNNPDFIKGRWNKITTVRQDSSLCIYMYQSVFVKC